MDLPVFFFIDRDIVEEPQLDNLDDVVLNYTFFRWALFLFLRRAIHLSRLHHSARRNDMGHAVPDAPEDVIQKSQGFENYELAKKA